MRFSRFCRSTPPPPFQNFARARARTHASSCCFLSSSSSLGREIEKGAGGSALQNPHNPGGLVGQPPALFTSSEHRAPR